MTTTDFTFAWEHADSPDGPWAHLQVVRFHGREELSSLYRYEITLLAKAPAPEIDPHALIGARATLRIATLAEPGYKLLHGVLVEAEEIAAVPEGMLYRVVLMPPVVRARHRTRCRIFLEKTTRQIVEAVLLGDPMLSLANGATVEDDDGAVASFEPAEEKLCWRMMDPSRIDEVRIRPYCVQYNESDLAFVARLLEDEGLSYHVENGAGVCLLVLSDSDQGKARLEPFDALGEILGRAVSTMKLGSRMREKTVRLRDYDWRKPALDLLAETDRGPADLFEYHWPGSYADAPSQGEPLAKARLERFHVEAEYATGEGACRLLTAGSVFRLEHAKTRYEGEYLVTKLDVRGEQQGVASVHSEQGSVPFSCTFECARRGHGATVQESCFRPARVTPKPRILGSQTAFVTADPLAPGAEIHVGGPPDNEIGCVRLRFHWDLDKQRLAREPSSGWVRVSQAFAGIGEGSVWHPRVGVEVIVEHIDGNPDRPIVTGRVYNGANRPPAPASGAATVSIFKSFASPGGGVHNEFGFDDTAGSEQVKMHAGKDWNSTIGHDRTEKVTNNSTSGVDVDRTESTGANRKTSVTGTNTESVDGDESIAVKSNQSISISVDQTTGVGADQRLSVGANRVTCIGANHTVSIGANDSLSVAGNRSVAVSGNRGEAVSGNADLAVSGNAGEVVSGTRSVTVTGTSAHNVAGDVSLNGSANITQASGANFTVRAGADAGVAAAAQLTLAAGANAVLQGASVHVSATGDIILSAGGSSIKIGGGGVEINGGPVKIAGSTVDVTGGLVKIN
jgi:type VI secretion system secreted protein VgrG